MALVKCPECQADMSSDALACPHCGHPNKEVERKRLDSKQTMGCLLMGFGLALGFFLPPIGVTMFVVGLVLFFVYTRAT